MIRGKQMLSNYFSTVLVLEKKIHFEVTGGPRLVRHLCQKLLKNRTIVNLGQAHTKFRTNQGH